MGEERARRHGYAYQATNSNQSQPFWPPPDIFPQPNITGSGVGGLQDGRHMNATHPQVQVQQIGHQRAPPPPPLQFPVHPTYPRTTSDHASAVPRTLPVAPQLDMNHYPRPPPAIPQPQVQARGQEHSAHPPPYHQHVGFDTSGPPNISGPRPPYHPRPSGLPYDGHGSSYELSHAPERTHQRGPNPPGWPSTPQPRAQPQPRPQPQPQPQYNPDREYQAHRHAQLSQPYTPRVAQKKALMVGINYSMHPDRKFRLNWGVNDSKEIARFLQERCGFHKNNIRILTDDQHDNLPTKANILAAMHWLVNGAQPGDSLFFYFSGHATQVKDLDGDEPDGYDECLCTMEYTRSGELLSSPATPGIIVDDHIHDIMVKPLQRGCRLTAVLDCCHSGTLLDLPFIYDSHGNLKQCSRKVIQLKSSEADVISLSACKDSERAFEAREGGALRRAFIEYMKTSGNQGSYFDVIQSLRAYMRANNFNQKPQLSSSHQININQRFII